MARLCSTWCVQASPRLRARSLRHALQVFEYLDTDLKKFMDLTGRGPSNPLPKNVVQVRLR